MKRPAWLLLAVLLVGGSALAAPVHIAAPQPGQLIHESDGRVGVVVSDLPPGSRLQAMLDGAPIGEVREAPAFELEDVPRGTHRLSVILLDDQGRELAVSEEVEFTLWRASVRLRPRLPAAGPPRP